MLCSGGVLPGKGRKAGRLEAVPLLLLVPIYPAALAFNLTSAAAACCLRGSCVSLPAAVTLFVVTAIHEADLPALLLSLRGAAVGGGCDMGPLEVLSLPV